MQAFIETSSPVQFFIVMGSVIVVLLFIYISNRPRLRSPTRLKLRQRSNAVHSEQVRELNVIFQFNGHSFDAYEVLGVPAGSDIKDVECAYQKARSNADPESLEFLDTAYRSISRK